MVYVTQSSGPFCLYFTRFTPSVASGRELLAVPLVLRPAVLWDPYPVSSSSLGALGRLPGVSGPSAAALPGPKPLSPLLGLHSFPGLLRCIARPTLFPRSP